MWYVHCGLLDVRISSEEEEAKLQAVFALDVKDVQLLIEVKVFVFERESVLQSHRYSSPLPFPSYSPPFPPLSSPLHPAQTSLFSQSCASQDRVVVERLRGRAFFPKQLEGINWRLNLSMAQPSQDKMKLPNAQFEFGIETGEVTVSGLDEALLCLLPVVCAMLFTRGHCSDCQSVFVSNAIT